MKKRAGGNVCFCLQLAAFVIKTNVQEPAVNFFDKVAHLDNEGKSETFS